jgi:bifunctional non-homologous end joining protein LigD
MPLNWTQVKKTLDPRAYTVRTAAALLPKSGAWSEYGKSASSLPAAMRRLTTRHARGRGSR